MIQGDQVRDVQVAITIVDFVSYQDVKGMLFSIENNGCTDAHSGVSHRIEIN